MDQDERRGLLARCLDEEAWPVRSRLAGALVLLFGLPATQIRHLRTDQVRIEDGHTYLDLDTHALFIPPKLAVLLHRQVSDPYVPLGTLAPEPERVWLFPGGLPGMPVTPARMSEWFADMGMAARPARNAALVALLADLPAPILAELVGMHVSTATRWASIARREWSDYLAAHAETVSPFWARNPTTPSP
ncbi:hypothetical protein HDA32_002678 [Spinactinospora alkalitolerans]|uniref:Tyr recombinase domain-containing protein n=1 Tax=Spinactinospora alkalitolerans TaxID=687207 RepID=A0A852TUE4_9ACTN|nr:hypothetical protein [Spinactinospora alkalitolerans]NYE47558.1 hypothetical protein [Spinactinospora alkalitolerans]